MKVFQLCYRLIKFSIKEYRPNEIYTSQWIELFMTQTLEFGENMDVLSEPTLTELVDNNKTVLENKINSAIIVKIANQWKAVQNIKYLKLMRALINCDGTAVVKNQNEITKLLLADKAEFRSKICGLSLNGSQI